MNEPKKNDFLATIWQHKSTIIAARVHAMNMAQEQLAREIAQAF